MPVNTKAVKKALDHFEDDKFSDAKDILKKEIKQAVKDKIADKTGIVYDKPKVKGRKTNAEKELETQISDLSKKREEMEAERIKKAEQRAKDREEKGLESEPEGTED